MISITTHAAHGIQSQESFGMVWVNGKTHNPNSLHRVVVFEGIRCCDFNGCEGVHLMAEAVVISDRQIPTEDYRAGTATIGDLIEVDGTVRVVTARPYADPVLIMVEA